MSPTVIRVSLLSGRYHAHPWGQAQHAMGGPEWPPSPWRLLRTIAACWFDAAEPPCSADIRNEVINALGRAGAPRIWIPNASFNEVPLYQPLTKEVQRNVGGKKVGFREVNSRVLHYDHFAVLAASNAYFLFDVDLSTEQRSFLSALLSKARYFGRTESRASVGVEAKGWQPPEGHYEAKPAGGDSGAGTLRRPVLVTTETFIAEDLWQLRQQDELEIDEIGKVFKGKKMRELREESEKRGLDPSGQKAELLRRLAVDEHEKREPASPVHLVEALISAKRPVPDGTRWLQYELPRAAIVQELPRLRSVRPSLTAQPAAEIAFRLFRRVPIPVLQTVLLARDFRDQAVHAYARATGQACVLLSGREEDGSIARGNRHAYYLPQPASLGGFLERFVVRLPNGDAGVEQAVLDALLGVTHLLKHDRYPVLVVPEEVRPTLAVPTTWRWRSLTPFLAPLRHRPRREMTDPAQQVLQSLRASVSAMPKLTPGEKQIIPVLSHLYDASGSGSLGRRRFRFTRRAAFAFEFEFSEPVGLPVALGADAHFGLGQFEPVTELPGASDLLAGDRPVEKNPPAHGVDR